MELAQLAHTVSQHGLRVVDGVNDVDEASEQVSRFGLRPNRLLPLAMPHSLDVHFDVIPPRRALTFARVSYGTELEVTPVTHEDDTFTMAVTLSGFARFHYGGEEAEVPRGSVGIIPPYRSFRAVITSDYSQVLVAIDRDRVESIAGALLDADSPVPIELSPSDIGIVDTPLLHLISAAAQFTARDEPVDHERLQERLEGVLIEAALMSRPSFRERIENRGTAHSRAVASAMEFMREHLSVPLSLTEVAASAHVSPRALQLAFSRETGTSPMRWLREQRLSRVRSTLLDPRSAHLSVADIAAASGLLHQGEFSQRYRHRYGETPTATRARAR